MKPWALILGSLLVGCSAREIVLVEGANGLTACGDAAPDAKTDAKADAKADAPADAQMDAANDAADAADAAEVSMEASADSSTNDASSANDGGLLDATSDGGPYVRQWGNTIWNPNAGIGQDLYVTLTQTLPGSAVVVFATEYNVSGNPAGTGPLSPVTVTDTASSAYALLDAVNSPPDLGGGMSFAATNVPASSSLVVHAAFVPADEWTGLVALEIANVSQIVAHGGTEVFNASKGQILSGPMLSLGAGAIAIALYVNGFDNSGAPGAGAGWATVGGVWNWGGLEGTATIPSGLVESALGSGTVTPTAVDLQTSGLQEDFLILALALQ